MMRAEGLLPLLAMAALLVAEAQGQHPQGHSRHLLVYDPSLPAQGVSLCGPDSSRSIALITKWLGVQAPSHHVCSLGP